MKPNNNHCIIEKSKKYLSENIAPSRYRITPITKWQYAEYESSKAPQTLADMAAIPESDYKPLTSSDHWGGYGRIAWFVSTVNLPTDINTTDTKPGFTIKSKGVGPIEYLLYVNGKPIQGIDKHNTEILLDESLLTTGNLEIAIKAWAAQPQPSLEASLLNIRTQVDEFYITALTLTNAMQLLNENDLRRIKLTKLLQETFSHINFAYPNKEAYYESITSALAHLSRGLALLRRPEIKPIIHTVGHSNANTTNTEKTSRAFLSVLNLMKQFPEYYFTQTSPQAYKLLAKDYPEIFSQIKAKIQSGQWEATGGMWVEADTNIPSGESLVRQLVYGIRYFKEELGVDATVLWLSNANSYSSALPQIAKKSGINYFATTTQNHHPHSTFNWRGQDGTKILAHIIPTENDDLTPNHIAAIWENYQQKEINEHILLPHGHKTGPTRETLMTRRVLEDLPGIPYVKTNKAEAYFKALSQSLEGTPLNTHDGELSLNNQSTYTTLAHNKKAIRQLENLLHNAELIAMIRDLKLATSMYPTAPLNEAWEQALSLQSHSNISHHNNRDSYGQLQARTQHLSDASTTALNKELKLNQNSIAVYNHLSWRRDTAEMLIPFSELIKEDSIFTDSEGYTLESQKTEGGLHVIFTELPPMGYKTFAISTGTPPEEENNFALETSGNTTTLDTNFYNVEFNQNGEITSLYDKLAMRKVNKGNLNVLEAHKENPITGLEYSPLETVEQGPLRIILRRKIVLNNTKIQQDIIFHARNRRIDFVTKTDWEETQTQLKTAFPLSLRATAATYDTQFGFIERSFGPEEVCGHKWADISESGYGVALFNDSKYGYACEDGILTLNLISPMYEERGTHEFTYALYPHLGNLVGSYVQTRAAELNSPIECYEIPATEGGYFVEFSLLKVEAQTPQLMDEDPSLHVIVDTVKKSEDGKDIILRVHESNNRALSGAVMQLDSCVRFTNAVETNLLEEPLPTQDIKVDGQSIIFDIKPFEIKTFRLVL